MAFAILDGQACWYDVIEATQSIMALVFYVVLLVVPNPKGLTFDCLNQSSKCFSVPFVVSAIMK
jgi:hypothetical protein